MWFIGVGVEQETSAPPPKKNPGSAPVRLGQLVYILVFYNISFSWLLPQDGFPFFFCAVFTA